MSIKVVPLFSILLKESSYVSIMSFLFSYFSEQPCCWTPCSDLLSPRVGVLSLVTEGSAMITFIQIFISIIYCMGTLFQLYQMISLQLICFTNFHMVCSLRHGGLMPCAYLQVERGMWKVFFFIVSGICS